MKHKIKDYLNLLGYKYSESSDTLKIHLGLSLQIIIQFSSDKILIKDKLVGWNFLTGLVVMSLKQVMIYNFVGSLIGTILIAFLLHENFQFYWLIFYILILFWVIIWTVYYLIKAESFKRTIQNFILINK